MVFPSGAEATVSWWEKWTENALADAIAVALQIIYCGDRRRCFVIKCIIAIWLFVFSCVCLPKFLDASYTLN